MANAVKEKSTAYLTVTFKNKSGSSAAPTAATYQVHDKLSGRSMLEETALTPAAEIEITLPPSVNTLVDSSKNFEIRVVTVKASFGVDDGSNESFEYTLQNLRYVA